MLCGSDLFFFPSSYTRSPSSISFISANFESLNHHLSNQLIMEFTLAICVYTKCVLCTQFIRFFSLSFRCPFNRNVRENGIAAIKWNGIE